MEPTVRRTFAILSVLAAMTSVVALGSVAQAAPGEQVFQNVGALDFTVPAGVTCLAVGLSAGQGGEATSSGGNSGGTGGSGANASGLVPVAAVRQSCAARRR